MSKAARNRRSRMTPTRLDKPTDDTLFGLDREMTEFVRKNRLEVWTATVSPRERLIELIDYNRDILDPEFVAAVMDAFNRGEASYKMAAGTVLTIVSATVLGSYFSICEERRMRRAEDPADYLSNFLDPSTGSDALAVDEARYLLTMVFVFHAGRPGREIFPDEGWVDLYRDTIVLAADLALRIASRMQKRLDAGEVSWSEIHGPCELDQRAA